MKAIEHILLFILVASTAIKAQGVVTATMKVSATIISGATLNNIQPINLNLEEGSEMVGKFEFITPKSADSMIEISDKITLINEFGEAIQLSSESIHQINNGSHSIRLLSKVSTANDIKLRGHYTGSISTKINYL